MFIQLIYLFILLVFWM